MAATTMLLPQIASLYVGDLDPEVTEMDLKEMFLSVGPVLSLRLCRCASTGKSLCYGYVNFFTYYQASKALEMLNHEYLKGKPMRIMWPQRNPYPSRSGIGNLFVKNLDASIDSARLQTIFSKFGAILSCKVVEEHGKSKGFGFVQFDLEDSALAAQASLHDTMIEGKKLYVSKFIKKSLRIEATPCEPKSGDLFVKNLSVDMTEDALETMFSTFGKISNVVIMKGNDGKSRGFGFVNFDSEEDAEKAIDALNGSQQGSQTLYIGRAQKKAEKIKTSKHEYKDTFNKLKFKDSNLYVKNLEFHVNDNDLRKLFSPCGKIVSAKVMRQGNGVSKGFGFVCFSAPEEAWDALNSLQGSIFEGKRLYVAIAQNKKERQLELQKRFAQCQSQSVYLPNCDVIPPLVRPFYFNYSPCPQSTPFLQNSIPYHNYGATMEFQYPPTAWSYRQTFPDYIPTGPMHQSSKNHADQSCQYSMTCVDKLYNGDMKHSYAGTQNIVSEKRWNKKGEPAGSRARALPATSCTALARSSHHSKKDTRFLLHSHVENLQPEHAGNMTGVLFEMRNLESPNSLAIPIDKKAQVLKEANSLKSADSGEPKPKSASRRLGY